MPFSHKATRRQVTRRRATRRQATRRRCACIQVARRHPVAACTLCTIRPWASSRTRCSSIRRKGTLNMLNTRHRMGTLSTRHTPPPTTCSTLNINNFRSILGIRGICNTAHRGGCTWAVSVVIMGGHRHGSWAARPWAARLWVAAVWAPVAWADRLHLAVACPLMAMGHRCTTCRAPTGC